MKNIMKRAWEIYRTLIGEHVAKLSMALKKSWREAKEMVQKVEETVKTGKGACIARLHTILNNSATYYTYELDVVINDWQNYGKDRTYFSIVEKSKTNTSKHYVKKEYGYFDNIENKYVPGKNDLNENYTFSGSPF